MAKVSAQEYAENWANGLTNAQSKMQRGVERTRKNPMERAVAAIPKMQQNFNAAVASGRVAAGFNSVTFEDWKRKYIQKGLPRVSQGATAAKPDMAKVGAAILAHIDSGLAELDNMPSMNDADNKARMLFWFDHMKSLKGQIR